ncbi:MAG: DUF3307 domain-containing protein [Flavobacterium sp.]|nr:DUF3307 domain-containing protein [Flavobacterium sp.]
MILIVKIILAHLLGDFIFQPNNWVQHKEANKLKSKYLYLHCLLHGILASLLVFEKEFLLYAFVLMAIHWCIDAVKLQFQTENTRRKWFIIDQMAHLISILIIGMLYQGIQIDFSALNQKYWIIGTGLLFLGKPTSILIRTLLSIWTPENKSEDQSLQNAGNYIGILERLFVICFILIDQFSAVGFLLGAKSIFRFGDLTEAKDRKLTEYVIIGTMLSFGIAIAIGLLVKTLFHSA